MKTKEQAIREEERASKRKLKVTFRVFQAIFLGIFALGVSSIFGDLIGFADLPIKSFSATTTIFGLIGSLVCGIMAKSSETW